jgi:hypothetical protein
MRVDLSVEELCRKLRPVFGKKVDLLYLQYKLSDSLDKKREIEQALNALFHKNLNDSMLNEKVLLEPPKQQLIQGEYPLGTVTYAEHLLYPFGLNEREWPRHVCISGMSGSGKTTFAYQILGNFIAKKKPFLAFDWKKSFRPLMKVDKEVMCFTIGNPNVANLFKININTPPKGVAPKEWLNILLDLINESFSASYGVHKVLSEVMDRAFMQLGVYEGSGNYPTWYQIYDRLQQKESDAHKSKGRESEWLTSAMRIAHCLTFGSFGEALNHKGGTAMTVEDLLDKQAIFELHSLNSMEKKFFCEFILTYIYKYKKGNQMDANEFRHAILVDEAHNIFLKDRPHFIRESVTDMVYREIREYGISLICLDQHISKLSDVVAGNSACNIAFQQVLPQDVYTVAGLMQLRDKQHYFSMLPVGHAIVKLAERFHTPFMIRVPMIDLKDELVTDDYVRQRMKQLAGFRRKSEAFQASCEEERLHRAVHRLDNVFRKSGVDVEDGYSEIYIKKEKTPLANHFQKHLSDRVCQLRSIGKEQKDIKQQLRKEGYKQADVSAALRYNKARHEPIELSLDEQRFLSALERQPNLKTSEAYNNLKISARKGNDIKNSLLDKGLIAVDEVRDCRGWAKVLRLAS